MKQTILKRAFTAFSALTLAISQLAVVAPTASAAAGETPPNGWNPVWCQYNNMWEARVGDTGGGSNPNRLPLTILPAGASDKLAIYYNADAKTPQDMVYASSGSDEALKTEMAGYCYDQYATPELKAQATTCDDTTTVAPEGVITVSITNTADLSKKPASYGITIDNVLVDTIELADGASTTKTYTGYGTGQHSVVITNSEDSDGSYVGSVYVEACFIMPTFTATPALTQTTECGPNNDVISFSNYDREVIDMVDSGWVNNTRTYTFTIKEGLNYVFDTGLPTYTTTLTDANTPCPADYPVAPAPTYECGPLSTATWTLPTDTEQIDWELVNNELIAYAKTGFEFTNANGEKVTEVNFGLAVDAAVYVPCYIGYPAIGEAEVCGPNNDVITPSTNEKYTSVFSGWKDGKATVTFTAIDGYAFDNGLSTYIYDVADENTPCPADYSTEFAYVDDCGAINDSLLLPDDTEQVSYSYLAINGYFVVSVKAKDGYYIEQDAEGQYIYEKVIGKVLISDYNPDLVCDTGMGGEKPVTPILPAPAKPAVAVQELPQTGVADMPNLLWTGLGVAVAVYGATYFAQRKQEN